MKKAIIVLIILLSVPAFAFKTENICTTAGWSVRADRTSDRTSSTYKLSTESTNATIYVEKFIDETAFKVRVLVYCYDYHDKFLGRIEFNNDGPLHSSWTFNANLPADTYKMTAEVYWKDKYE